MNTKKYLTAAALFCLALLATSCIGGGGAAPANPDYQKLQIDVWKTGNGIVDLTLRGPVSSRFAPVTYYIFGSNTDLGDTANVPLEPQRLHEEAFGPFNITSDPVEVDLSPWDQYSYIYLRAISVQPNRAYKLKTGYLYEISTN